MGLSSDSQKIINIKELLSQLSFEFVNFNILVIDKHKAYYHSETSNKIFFDSNFALYALMNLLSVRNATEFNVLTTQAEFDALDGVNRIDYIAEIDLELEGDEYVIHNGQKSRHINNITVSEDELNYYRSQNKHKIKIHNIKYFIAEEKHRSAHVDAMTLLFKLAGEGKIDELYQKLMKTIEMFINEATLEYRIYNAQLIYRDCCLFVKNYVDTLEKEGMNVIAVDNAYVVYEKP